MDGVTEVDVKTKMDDVVAKLDSTAGVHVSSVETLNQSYTLSQVLEQTLTNKVALVSTDALVAGLGTSKQNVIDQYTNLIAAATNTQSIINESTILQKGTSTTTGRSFYQGLNSTYYKDSGGTIMAQISYNTGLMRGKALEYDDAGANVDVKTQIDLLNSKLSSTTSILTSSLESAD